MVLTRAAAIAIASSAALAVVLICAIYNPSYLSDKNEFMHHFVNHELLALLGIIMTITLASAASLHLEFNKIEERYFERRQIREAIAFLEPCGSSCADR